MGTTSRGYPYPEGQSTVQVPADIKALALALDADVAAIAPRIKQVQRVGTGQSIPDSSSTAHWTTVVGFNTTTIQVGASITYGSGIFTVDFTGAVAVSLYIGWPVASSAHRTIVHILKNGSAVIDGADTKWYPSGTAGQTYQRVSTDAVPVVPGDTISQEIYQDSGSAMTTLTDQAVFTIRRVA